MIFGWWLMVGSVVCAACEMKWVVVLKDDYQVTPPSSFESKSLNPEVACSILAEVKRS